MIRSVTNSLYKCLEIKKLVLELSKAHMEKQGSMCTWNEYRVSSGPVPQNKPKILQLL